MVRDFPEKKGLKEVVVWISLAQPRMESAAKFGRGSRKVAFAKPTINEESMDVR